MKMGRYYGRSTKAQFCIGLLSFSVCFFKAWRKSICNSHEVWLVAENGVQYLSWQLAFFEKKQFFPEHENISDNWEPPLLTIKSDTGQNSQFLRSLLSLVVGPNIIWSLFCHCVLCKLDLTKTWWWVVALEILDKHHLWIVWHRQDLLIGQRPPIYFTGLRKYTKAWFHLLTNWI